VVKLGGGLITFKEKPGSVDWESLRLAAGQLSAYMREGGRLLAVVHGGGSFGHHEAMRAMEEGFGAEAVARVQGAMNRLSAIVASALADAGIPVALHHARSICTYEWKCFFEPLKRDVELGLVPLTHGDAVPSPRGGVILGGDRLAVEIAVALGAECLIYASRVGGVYGRDGSLLRVVRDPEEVAPIGAPTGDVTGGMKAKVSEALRASMLGVRRVVIVGGSYILAALRGDEVGTRVVAKP
jgi:isopentenyl phosphate kinase